ncbi:MAG: VWA domain-containing protein, partial [Acidobacteriota bacterium]
MPDRISRRSGAAGALFVFLLVVGSGAAAAVFAQGPPPVLVDVRVLDDEGRFVEGITASSFVVREDGVVQPVRRATLVTPRVEHEMEESEAAAAGMHLLPARERAAMVFVLDGRRIDGRGRARFIDAMEKLLEGAPAIPHAIYAIGAEGVLREIVPLTRDPAALREGLGRLPESGAALPSRTVLRAGPEEQPRDVTIPDIAEGQHAYELLADLALRFRDREGRTALVWVSTGTDALGVEDLSSPLAADFDPRHHAAVAPVFAHRALNTARVSVYGVDPSGRRRETGFGAAEDLGPGDLFETDPREAADPAAGEGTDPARRALELTSRATGGEAFLREGQDLDDVFREIRDRVSRFYLIAYDRPEPVADGRWHDLEVEVDIPGLRASHRPGYVDDGARSRGIGRVAAAADLPDERGDVPLDLEALPRLNADGTWSMEVGVALSPPERLRDRPWVVHAEAVDGGSVVDVFDRRLSAGEVAYGGPGALIRTVNWQLPPGDYELRVAVFDPSREHVSADQLRGVVPRPCEGWCVAPPRFVARSGEGLPTLVIGNVVRRGSLTVVLVEVWGGEQPVLSGTIFSADGKEVMGQGEPHPMASGGRRLASGGIALPPDLVPGGYLLDIRVTDPDAGHSKAFRV